MPDQGVPVPPPGWYADPEGSGMRYWDGAAWTEHVTLAPASSGRPAQQVGSPAGGPRAMATDDITPTWESTSRRAGDGVRRRTVIVVAAVLVALASLAAAGPLRDDVSRVWQRVAEGSPDR